MESIKSMKMFLRQRAGSVPHQGHGQLKAVAMSGSCKNIFLPLILINDIVCKLSVNDVIYKQSNPTKAIFRDKPTSPIGRSSHHKTDSCAAATS